MILRRAIHRRRQASGIGSPRPARVLAAGLVLVSGVFVVAPPSGAQPVNAKSVTVTIDDVTPTTPPSSTKPTPLTVTLDLANNTDQTLTGLTIEGARSNPITTRKELDEAIHHTQPPDPNLVSVIATAKPVTASLGPRGTTTVSFTALTSTDSSSSPGVCVCENRIYPLYFTVHAKDSAGSDVVVGAAQTYVPAFATPPTNRARVSWVWPIIDRPHRLVGDTTFTDDDLAYLIAGGRLDRVLSVVELVAEHDVAMTLVMDPELLDEISVMSAGSYSVLDNGKRVVGSGTAAAKAWLTRLRNALTADPQLELEFTPLADPDVESLGRNGLSWTTGLPPAVQARITAALGGHSSGTSVGWPVDGVVTGPTLAQLVRDGATSVIVSDSVLPSPGGANTTNQLGALQTPAGQATADVLQSSIQSYVDPVLSVGSQATSELPKLVAEVAVTEMSQPASAPFVVIAAPREVNPIPEVALRAVLETAQTSWSTSLTLDTAAHTVTPSDHGQLITPASGTGGLSDLTIDAAKRVSQLVPALATMMSAADASHLLGLLPIAVQRAESSAWRTAPAAGDAYARALDQQIEAVESGVRIVHPANGTYTLTSSNAPLPVTVENNLDVTVQVRVQLSAANDLPGFSAKDGGLQTIAPNTKVTLHIPTHVERTGRFQVQAILMTPNDVQIGDAVRLSVHSTALGTIGVVITIAAAVVLAIALLVRLIRRLRSRRRSPRATATEVRA